MKAILVVNIPDDYGDVYDNKAIVTLRNGKLGTSLGIYNVPLKPLPRELDYASDWEDVEISFRQGWNACLDKIVGET